MEIILLTCHACIGVYRCIKFLFNLLFVIDLYLIMYSISLLVRALISKSQKEKDLFENLSWLKVNEKLYPNFLQKFGSHVLSNNIYIKLGLTSKMKRDYYIWVQNYSIEETGRSYDYKTWILCNSCPQK